ncbi:sodium:proton antiporter [Arenibaculum sp.]|uniref:cation:proton antiporter n=1 Tax=Arenibaculum sp. TaxID=2865862 RepID=UPI002E12DB5B|nr:sodium:proton antiporter [Arenibaculum sp.]
MEAGVLVVVMCIVVGGFAAQWLAWRLAVPAIVVLLAVGLLVGPVFGLLDPSESFGPLLRPTIGLVVAIIVFEGGLSLDLRELQSTGSGIVRLTIVALPLNWAFGALAGHYVGGLAWPAAILFGAILVVTGPTVILPLLRQSRLRPRPASFLKWEAIVNDPIGAVLAVIVLEVLVSSAHGATGGELVLHLAVRVFFGVLLALGLGIGAAFLVRWAFRRDQVPEVLKTPMLIACTLGVYALPNVVMEEAGLIAATVFGVALANLGITGIEELRRFKEALVVLLVSALFIILTADLDPDVFGRLSLPILALTFAVLFLVRPAAIMLATLGSRMSLGERALVAWIGPRGIVAAAVAGVAGLRLDEAGYRAAELILPTVFVVIAATVIAHGFTLGALARRVGLTGADKPGLLIVGATGWTISLAELLSRHDVPVLLVDIFEGALAPARRKGLETLQVEVLSELAEHRLAGRPVDHLLAATADDIYNALVCAKLGPEVGRERVFEIAPKASDPDPHRGLSRNWRGKFIMDRDLCFDEIVERCERGWRFAAFEAAGSQPLSDFAAGFDGVPLLIIRANGNLELMSPELQRPVSVDDGDRVVMFVAPSRAAGAGASDARLA